ncbi:uncharacterized protein LOC105251757 isoform X2 [Camponotus floridanus]|uniref:uncharacterized protein LOC105251757 isoform X2 n=1 Tax=Camponotus floridanus TaxID=104421 RepID=UPI00059D6D34|nr:uncharacterized protein LOC105251757 isoform X2 [Camponotus floridanus]
MLNKSWPFVIIIIAALLLMAQARWWNRIKNEEGRRGSHEFEPSLERSGSRSKVGADDSSYRFPREFQNKMERIETKRRDEEEDETSEMRERIDREEKKSTISSKGGRLVAAHSGHRTSEEPELVGTQDAYKSDNGGPARGPPGPVHPPGRQQGSA